MRIQKTKKVYIITFAIIILLILIGVAVLSDLYLLPAERHNSQTPVSNDVLDLTNWNPNTDGLIKLDGQWEFYWKKLLTSDDLQENSSGPDLMAEVPDVWNNYRINGKSLPGFGFATYKLTVKN